MSLRYAGVPPGAEGLCSVCGRRGPLTERGTPHRHKHGDGRWCAGSAVLALPVPADDTPDVEPE